MKIQQAHLVYFSATYTTKKIVQQIATQIGAHTTEYDVTKTTPQHEIVLNSQDLLIVGVPVYAGRIPEQASHALRRIKGNGTPALLVCVYGNRDYDDALLELKDSTEANGFKVISAGAFIARHSIFPTVGTNRPDEKDAALIHEFTAKSLSLLQSTTDFQLLSEVSVKGNRPYRTPGKIPLQPKGNRKCNACGSCVKLCPVQAIPKESPRKTDKEKCISCGRCIVICPQAARHFGGLLYKLVRRKFVNAYSVRKEPETMFAKKS